MLQIWFARSLATIGDAFLARAASLVLHSPSGRVFETGKFARGRRQCHMVLYHWYREADTMSCSNCCRTVHVLMFSVNLRYHKPHPMRNVFRGVSG